MLDLKRNIKGTNIKIIEDCSQAHGASIKNQKVGSFGDIGVWSFCNDKIISTGGEGGMVATNSKYLANKIWTLKEIGKDIIRTLKIKKSNNFPYIHDHIGTNARMTEIQSAIGRYQLKNLNYFIEKRNMNAKILFQKLSKFKSLNLPKIPNNYKHAFYRYVIILNSLYIKKNYSRSKIMDLIYKEKIFCNVGGCPAIYKELYFKKNNFVPKKKLHNTEFISDKTISFQIDHTITKKDLLEMSQKLQKIFYKVTKS
jgi:dTDP-4-amino-4,6-dideoxygalactose transaminase